MQQKNTFEYGQSQTFHPNNLKKKLKVDTVHFDTLAKICGEKNMSHVFSSHLGEQKAQFLKSHLHGTHNETTAQCQAW